MKKLIIRIFLFAMVYPFPLVGYIIDLFVIITNNHDKIQYLNSYPKTKVQTTTEAITAAKWDIKAAVNVCLEFFIPTAPKYTAIV